MNTKHWPIAISIFFTLVLSPALQAEEPGEKLNLRVPLNLEFDEVKLGGFERQRLGNGLKVRGWQVGRAFVGQTKVARHWGLGFVYLQGNTIYGMNHRGIQITRRF